MDKRALVNQLSVKLRGQLNVVRRAGTDAQQAVRDVATEQEKKADARQSIEFGSLATGHLRRARQLTEEIEALEHLPAAALGRQERIGIGSIVEIEDEESHEGRTFLVLPVGAGEELTVDGDGLLTVATAHSPIGRAVVGHRQGDSVQVTLQGEPKDWTITYVE